jgi:hypothetical protein
MHRFDPKQLIALATAPENRNDPWYLEADRAVQYVTANSKSNEVVIYASAPFTLIIGALAPAENLAPPDGEALQNLSLFTDVTWRIQKSWSTDEGHRVYIEPPFPEESGSALAGGEPLIIRRRLEGVHTGPTPIEINQKLVHCLDIHYVPERKAYCRLDDNGDIEDVIRILTLEIPDQIEGREVVTILRKDLDNFMVLADMALVVKFDFTRYVKGSFNTWKGAQRYNRSYSDLFYHGGTTPNASFAHGALIARPASTVEEQEEAWRKDLHGDPDREYAVFKIYDRKNDRIVETSCSPEHIVSYFENSNLPWQISPAFFRAEVLNRFKGDPEKYTLEDRTISCRGGWYLKSYDINEAGQVHVYIGDLSNLPYEEQLYWKAFNEWPKAPISERAHQTDIEGDWYTKYLPLDSLKRKIRALDRTKPAWWSPRGEELIDSVLAPATDSPKEWGDEIMALDQCLVEGFLDKPLRKAAEERGRVLDPNWRSLKLLFEIMVGCSISADDAKQILAPLRKLHELRNEIRGHATNEKKAVAIREARTTHGNFRSHFFHLAEGCDHALGAILKALQVDIND